MPASTTRRPLPALAFLLALTVLTSIVWWRVLHRSEAVKTPAKNSAITVCPSPSHRNPLPAPAAVTITVLNGAERTGLAATVQGQLKTRGFATAGVGNAAVYSGVAEIRYGTAGKSGATLVSYYIPGAKLMPIKRSNAAIDVILGKKFTSLASDTAAKAAARKAGTGC